MAIGGSIGLRAGVVAAVGCVAVAVILTAAGTLSGSRHGNVATSGKVSVTTTVAKPAPSVEADAAHPADPAVPAVDPEASPEATSSEPVPPATPPAVLPTEALPTEVAQSLADLAAQLSQAGDDGRPQEMTREEVVALVNAQLQALGIQL